MNDLLKPGLGPRPPSLPLFSHTHTLSLFLSLSHTQSNDAQLAVYLDSESHKEISEEVKKELATTTSTVTPWWWALKTLIKVRLVVWPM